MKISIIIPVHNADKYLKRCVESVIDSLKASPNIKGEILLIDNNSTDKSPSMMKSLKKKNDGLISLLKTTEPGASATRNYGLEKARGEYVWFIDADDAISKDAVSKLLCQAEQKKADLVMMRAERIYPDGRHDYLPAINPDSESYKSRFVRYGLAPWQVMFRRKWWQNNGFSFKEGVIHEDMELMSALILATDKFASVDEPLYFYYQNPGSVLHKEAFDAHIFDIFPNLESLYQRFVDKGAEKEYHDELEYFFIWNLLIDSAKDFAKFTEGKPGFNRSRKLLKKYFPKWRRNKFLAQKPLKVQIFVRLNYYK